MNQVGGNLPVIVAPLKTHLDDYRYECFKAADFLKLVFVPRVPYSVPGVFTLCTIFGRKPGFQVGYQ